MPYKVIASQLEKTELACRLHYHQLSHGGNRRKRTSSMSSSDSSPSTHSILDPLRRSISPPRSCSSPIDTMKILQRSTSGFQALNSPPPSDDANGQTSDAIKSLTSSSSSSKHKRVKRTLDSIDREKLDQLVKSHTEKLWTAVAAEYGEEYSPEMLEKAWKKKIVKKITPTTTTTTVVNTSTASVTTMAPPPPSSTYVITQSTVSGTTNIGSTTDDFVEEENEEEHSVQSDKLLRHSSSKEVSETKTIIETTHMSPTSQQTKPNVTNVITSTLTSPPRPVLPSVSILRESSPRQLVDSPRESTAKTLNEKCRISMPSGMCEVPMINAK